MKGKRIEITDKVIKDAELTIWDQIKLLFKRKKYSTVEAKMW